METISLENDINVFYIAASSFPMGVMEAHQKLHALVPPAGGRRYFGISRPENGAIAYKAAAEEQYDGEAEKLGCETLVLKKGKYISEDIADFMQNIPAIGATFQKLLSYPGIDQNGYCVEWYFNDKDVRCMVRLGD
jgi:hypothetical protein